MPVYLSLLSAAVRSQLAYRRSFWLELLGRFVLTGLELCAVFALFLHIEDLGGWTRWEVVYLYGAGSLSLGLAELFTDGLNEVPELVRRGTLDALLVRPVSALSQAMTRQFRLFHVGRIAQGVVVLAWSLYALELSAGPLQIAAMGVQVLGCAAVYGGIFIANAGTCIFTVQSAEVFNAFTYGGLQMTQYPVPIYRPWMRNLFLYGVPVGFVSYFPALVALGKPDALGLPGWFPALAPLVAIGFTWLCVRYWRFAIDRYQGAGG